MSRAAEPQRVDFLCRTSTADVFAVTRVGEACAAHTLVRRAIRRGDVREIVILGHVARVRGGERVELRVARQRGEARVLANGVGGLEERLVRVAPADASE